MVSLVFSGRSQSARSVTAGRFPALGKDSRGGVRPPAPRHNLQQLEHQNEVARHRQPIRQAAQSENPSEVHRNEGKTPPHDQP